MVAGNDGNADRHSNEFMPVAAAQASGEKVCPHSAPAVSVQPVDAAASHPAGKHKPEKLWNTRKSKKFSSVVIPQNVQMKTVYSDVNPIVVPEETLKKLKMAAIRDIAIGGVICAGGVTFTIMTYLDASEKNGGRYTIFYGAMLWGAFQFAKGIHQAIKYRGKNRKMSSI